GHKTAEGNGNGDSQSWTYNYFGRLQTSRDLGSVATTYTYDQLGQPLTQTAYGTGSVDNAWGARTQAYNTSSGGFQLIDMNGDGLRDLIYDSSDATSNIRVLLNTGTSFGPDTAWGTRTKTYNTSSG